MVRAHRHDTARLGVRGVIFFISVLVAHLLDQSGVFGVWSTVALGGRGHAAFACISWPASGGARRGAKTQSPTEDGGAVAAADCRALKQC